MNDSAKMADLVGRQSSVIEELSLLGMELDQLGLPRASRRASAAQDEMLCLDIRAEYEKLRGRAKRKGKR